MRKLFLIILLVIAAGYSLFVYMGQKTLDVSQLPPLESGDLIFETTTIGTLPIIFATHSLYTHVGIIHKLEDGHYTVIHASNPMSETPLEQFVTYGYGERVMIRRYPGLSEEDKNTIVARAQHYIGRPYNFVYYIKSNAVYCSEVPYLIFNSMGKKLGTLQTIGELHVDNFAVHTLFDQRWRDHPACQEPGIGSQACWDLVMKEPIITPVSLEEDPNLTTVYSNYWF